MSRESGFTLVEVMIAIVVLMVGLLGVAAMQTKALQANVFAGRVTEGCAVGEAWMEWLMKQPYDRVAAQDVNPNPNLPDRVIPSDGATVINSFQTWGLGTFTEEQLPNPRNAGSTMTWRITADYPIENTTTVEINTAVAIKKIDGASQTNSTVTKPMVLRFTRSRHM
jgi:prepilin-type N-terminal cleavage/methylation domain-containing protein